MPVVNVTYKFTLPEERDEFEAVVNAPRLASAMDNFSEWLRAMDKHTDENFWPKETGVYSDKPNYKPAMFDAHVYGYFFERIRAKFWECMSEQGAEL